MTCIIGGRCSDGVVLSADRKIVDVDIRDVTYRKKLYQYYYPIVVGSSGHIDPFDNFMKEALEAAQNITSNSPYNINQTNFWRCTYLACSYPREICNQFISLYRETNLNN